ncbi:MAG: hexokinase [Spirochaetaceae bacterium]|jgi:hexokinase|nr:hexokinase [Spirochaetaceae bacterium]
MKFNSNELSDFARYYGFHYDCCSPEVIIQDFMLDAQRGLRGEESYMMMIPSYIKPESSTGSGKTVLALDAGGTNFRGALVSFDKTGKAVTQNTIKTYMPGSRGRVSAKDFYNAIADVCEPLLKNASCDVHGIGFCFSYGVKITEDGDAYPEVFSKEIDAPEVLGKPLGKAVIEVLKSRGVKTPERIILLNDTTAALLTGVASVPARFPSKLSQDGLPAKDEYGVPAGPIIGLILGTGFNIAYPEKVIPKIGYNSDKPQIMVTEAGNLYFRYRGILDKRFDSLTKAPGMYSTEKALSGAYLGDLSLIIFKQAIKDGVLSFEKQEEILAMENLQTRDLNAFLHAPLSRATSFGALFGTGEVDAAASVYYLASIVTERAALLTASLTAAAAIKASEDYNPMSPVRIAVEGTTYQIYHCMKEAFESRLRDILATAGTRYAIVTPVEQASLIGAAVAALT